MFCPSLCDTICQMLRGKLFVRTCHLGVLLSCCVFSILVYGFFAINSKTQNMITLKIFLLKNV